MIGLAHVTIAIAVPTPRTMSQYLQAWTRAYTGAIALFKVSMYYRGMSGIA